MAVVTGAAANMLGAAGIANAGTGVLNALKGSKTDSGSIRSSKSSASSVSRSNTAGNIASERSRLFAEAANSAARQNWETAAQYNSYEAAVNRAWQEYMSNTQYQRAVEDMKKAGINPILAASNGISGASIGSGATASLTAPETFMGQSIAEQNSASSSQSHGESSGSSWSHSESGLATGLGLLADAIKNLQGGLNSSLTIENVIKEAEKTPAGKVAGKVVQDTKKSTKKAADTLMKSLKNVGKSLRNSGREIYKDIKGNPKKN